MGAMKVWNGSAFVQIGGSGAKQLTDLTDVTAKTGSGTTVVMDTSPTIVTPTVADLTNMGHDHSTTAGGGQLHVRYRTVTKILYIETPEATDSYPIAYIEYASVMRRVVAVTDTGTVDFNINKRVKLTPDVSSANYLEASDLQAAAAGLDDTAFSNASLTATEWLHYEASVVASSPTKLWVSLTYDVA